MSSRRVIAGAAIVGCAILALVAFAVPPRGPRAAPAPSTKSAPVAARAAPAPAPTPRFASPRELPPGDGKSIADRACLMCHSAMLITQQAKDSLGWEKTITQMEKWGAPLSPAEHDSARGYFVSRFGPHPSRGLDTLSLKR